MKENKGITLVALIITIIVMMILVAVSVAVILRSDLLGTAKNAGTSYRSNMDEEQGFGTGSIKIAGESGEKTWDEYMQSICNHEYGEWIVVSEPETIYETGEKYRDCSKCGIRQTETISMNECEEKAHTYGEYIIDTEATCQEKGEKHKTCSTCGKTVTEEIAVDETAHQYEDGECTICGETEQSEGQKVEIIPEQDSYTIGQEVTIGEEHFYVIADNATEIKLLTKDCIDTENLVQSPNAQLVAFSTEWYGPGISGDIEENETIIDETTGNLTLPVSHIAAKAAYDYGTKIGGSGRLMFFDEADELDVEAYRDILYGTNGKSSGSYLLYWLATYGDYRSGFISSRGK